MKYFVIGIADAPHPFLPPDVLQVIARGRVFSGGKRHHELVGSLLPEGAQWIDITVPLDAVFAQYRQHDEVVVFASGDPLFYGFANTIVTRQPDAQVVLYPWFNSLQTLAHRLVLPYHDMRIVSLTGRPWPELDRALIERATKIGVLTDRIHTPAAIARRMLDYGYSDYTMHVGEHLGNIECERVSTLSLPEAAESKFDYPNCLIVTGHDSRPRHFGIPEREFALLDGREKMITKAPIRLLSLQALRLQCRHVLWDIGFCTGSVSIEARLQFPHVQVIAFEIRRECEALMAMNSRRHGTPGIDVHMGDFLQCDLSALPRPDAVFIGGHGGKLKEIMARVLTVLSHDGCMVMNSVTAPRVTTDSHQLWNDACTELGLTQEQPLRIVVNDNHPIEILTCRR
ncbi:MAG: precorrin-6y C5,15-methyltransferase (decarboxylating) subunit CbiE [Muribaculaceae bacterium]|nr:precorrin-6y C5,15-methyltransferase (decarboxylating) subunit CbiE [Muribaculaceae bacterium]